MSLDQNLFTLLIAPNQQEDSVDLTDPNGNIHYRKRKRPTTTGEYIWDLYDPLSDSILATASGENPTSKKKVIELHNPTVKIDLTFTGTMSFKWQFDFEEHTWEWRKGSCYLIRKPDPPVQIAVNKDTGPQTKQIQLLDYNLNRFDVQDRKGLEILLLTSFLTFGDLTEEYRAQSRARAEAGHSPAVTPPAEAPRGGSPTRPPIPPKPPRSGMEIVSSVQRREKTDLNEVVVAEEGEVPDYAMYCAHILKDPSLLYIIIRAKGAEEVQKVVAVAEETKRARHRQGEEDLHQYVRMDEAPQKKGPKIIKLDDRPEPPKPYKPPTTLTIHLSKIPMPELMPKGAQPPQPPPAPSSSAPGKLKGKDKERDKDKDKGKDKDKDKKAGKGKTAEPPQQLYMPNSYSFPAPSPQNVRPPKVPPGAEPPAHPPAASSSNPFARSNRPSTHTPSGSSAAPPGALNANKLGKPSASPSGGGNSPAAPGPPPSLPAGNTLGGKVADGVSQLGFSLLDRLTKR